MRILAGSKSQAGQESFVVEALGGKKNGFFVEIGAWHGLQDSNTYALEKQFGWHGIAFEIVPRFVRRYNRQRSSRCFRADATLLNFDETFVKNEVPSRVDYLQLDIEPGTNTLSAMLRVPFESHRFSVITFEHDLYRSQENFFVKKWSEDFLGEKGYAQVISNVMFNGMPFEDWWVDPLVVSKDFIERHRSKDVEWATLFET